MPKTGQIEEAIINCAVRALVLNKEKGVTDVMPGDALWEAMESWEYSKASRALGSLVIANQPAYFATQRSHGLDPIAFTSTVKGWEIFSQWAKVVEDRAKSLID